MNKRYLMYSVLSGLFIIAQTSSAMSGGKKIVLYGARCLGAGTFFSFGSAILYDDISFENRFNKTGDAISSLSDQYKKEFDINKRGNFVPVGVEKIIRKKLNDVGTPNADKVAIVSSNQWASFKDKILFVDRNNINELHLISMVTAHEASHMINQDGKKMGYITLAAACGIQGLSWSVAGLINKMFKIQVSKTWSKALLRSFGSIISVLPKLELLKIINQVCSQMQEIDADEFACKNAESIKELEVFRDDLLRQEWEWRSVVSILSGRSEEERMAEVRALHASFDPTHPYPGDRADRVQKHIDRWKESHKESNC